VAAGDGDGLGEGLGGDGLGEGRGDDGGEGRGDAEGDGVADVVGVGATVDDGVASAEGLGPADGVPQSSEATRGRSGVPRRASAMNVRQIRAGNDAPVTAIPRTFSIVRPPVAKPIHTAVASCGV
jgi:hypothetical protein